MKKLLLYLLLLHSIGVKATNYYLSATGSDSNNGTSTATPWQTLSKISGHVFYGGDSILFKRGDTFYGTFNITWPGTSGNNIIYAAYGTGANPIISGFTSVTAWTNLGGNIWESTNTVSSLASNCNIVLINGTNTPMGRYPKITDTNKGYYTYQSHSGQTSITSSNLTGTPNWTGAEVVIRNQAFHLKRAVVTSQSGSTINFGDIGEGLTNGNGFFFQNDIRCCTQQNEWYYNQSTYKLRIYSTSQPTNVKLATVENLIVINNANYLTFKNLDFTGANGCAFYSDIHATYHDVLISNCRFYNIGVCGWYGAVSNTTITNCKFTDINTTAIEFTYGNGSVASNDTITRIGLLHGMRNNIVYTFCNSALDCSYVTGYTVINNKITNVGFNGISCWGSTNVLIKQNYIDTFCSVLDDGGGVYLYAGTSTFYNGKIQFNTIMNGIGAVEGSTFAHHGHGVYLDQGTGNIEVSYNSCSNNAGSGIYATSAGYNKFRWNTCYNNSESQINYHYFGGTDPIPTHDTIANNIFVAKLSGIGTYNYQNSLYIYFSDSSKFRSAFYADSNYYSRPYSEGVVVFISAGWPNWLKSLAAWKGFSGKDIHSKGSYQTVTTTSDIYHYFNPTASSKLITLPNHMIGIDGTRYSSSLILQPFSSKVVLLDYNPPVTPGSKVKGLLRGYKGKLIQRNGKIYYNK